MKKILVVDDNIDNRYLMTFILRNNDYEVIEAINGQQAVAQTLAEKPDLILMDIQLPDIDGLEATRQIRHSPANGDIPIIAITSYALSGDKNKALEAGCTAYIEKPIDTDLIIDQIKDFFSA